MSVRRTKEEKRWTKRKENYRNKKSKIVEEVVLIVKNVNVHISAMQSNID